MSTEAQTYWRFCRMCRKDWRNNEYRDYDENVIVPAAICPLCKASWWYCGVCNIDWSRIEGRRTFLERKPEGIDRRSPCPKCVEDLCVIEHRTLQAHSALCYRQKHALEHTS